MSNRSRAFIYLLRKRKETFVMLCLIFIVMISIGTILKAAQVCYKGISLLNDNFYDSKLSISTLLDALNMSLIGIVLVSVFLFSMIIFFRSSNRLNEIGIYLAIGKSKLDLFLQEIWEIITLIVFILPFAVFIVEFVGQKIGRKLLVDALNISMEGLSLSVGDAILNEKNMIIESAKNLKANFDVNIILIILLILVLTAIISTLIGNIKIVRLKVKEILSKND